MKSIIGFCAIFIFFTQAIVALPIDLVDVKTEMIGNDSDHQIEELADVENEIEYGELFEGDMDLTDDQLAAIIGERNVINGDNYRWPNNTVPYVLSEKHTKEQHEFIVKAMKEIESHTCITFKERSNENDYLQFEVGYFCLFHDPYLTFSA